eukprot:jgi/Bigna1/146513/aug1.115_g21221
MHNANLVSTPSSDVKQHEKEEEERIVFHIDVDSFYVEAERLRHPELKFKPVAVRQFNSGGFVAVSYEARSKGIRKGDGAGSGGREAIVFLRDKISEAEALRKCPGLVVLPMDTAYYRFVSREILKILTKCVSSWPDATIEKSSYDDYYVEATTIIKEEAGEPGAAAALPLAATRKPNGTYRIHYIPDHGSKRVIM